VVVEEEVVVVADKTGWRSSFDTLPTWTSSQFLLPSELAFVLEGFRFGTLCVVAIGRTVVLYESGTSVTLLTTGHRLGVTLTRISELEGLDTFSKDSVVNSRKLLFKYSMLWINPVILFSFCEVSLFSRCTPISFKGGTGNGVTVLANSEGEIWVVVASRNGAASNGATNAPRPKLKWRACMNGPLFLPHKSKHSTLPPVSRKPIDIPRNTMHAVRSHNTLHQGVTVINTAVRRRLINSRNSRLKRSNKIPPIIEPIK